jgi:hypothetical protein
MIATFGYSGKIQKEAGDIIMLYDLPSRFHNKPNLTHFKATFGYIYCQSKTRREREREREKREERCVFQPSTNLA